MSAPGEPVMLEAALALAAQGFAVFPIYEPSGEGGCACGCAHPACWERAKHPRIPDRATAATGDEAAIRAWWGRWPPANVGIAGARSNPAVIVVDVDIDPAGGDHLAALISRFGQGVLATVRVRTGSGGWHLYYRAPGGLAIRTQKGRLGPGVDIQAYWTAPPSQHVNLNRFAWVEGAAPWEREVAPLPAAIEAVLRARPPLAWYARQAPYLAADRLGLGLTARGRLRAAQRRIRRLPGFSRG